jgi:hypothetical protein
MTPFLPKKQDNSFDVSLPTLFSFVIYLILIVQHSILLGSFVYRFLPFYFFDKSIINFIFSIPSLIFYLLIGVLLFPYVAYKTASSLFKKFYLSSQDPRYLIIISLFFQLIHFIYILYPLLDASVIGPNALVESYKTLLNVSLWTGLISNIVILVLSSIVIRLRYLSNQTIEIHWDLKQFKLHSNDFIDSEID